MKPLHSPIVITIALLLASEVFGAFLLLEASLLTKVVVCGAMGIVIALLIAQLVRVLRAR